MNLEDSEEDLEPYHTPTQSPRQALIRRHPQLSHIMTRTEEINKIKNLIESHKLWLHRLQQDIIDYCDYVKTTENLDKSTHFAKDVTDLSNNYRTQFTKLQELYFNLISIDPTHRDQHEEAIAAISADYKKQLLKGLLPLEEEVLGSSDEPTQPRQPVYEQANKAILQDLKPFTLEKGHNPVKFNEWKDRVFAYFQACNHAARPVEQQRAYLRSLIDPDLWTLLESKMGNLPVYADQDDDDDNSIMKVITTQFYAMQPLMIRRYRLFAKKQSTQPATQFIAEIRADSRAAAVSRMDENSVTCFLILKGLRDPELTKEIMKLPESEITVPKIEEIAGVYETSTLAAKTLTHTSNQTFKMTSGYYCNTCGSTSHPRDKCKFRNNICFNCEKVGHLAKICHSPKVEHSDDSTTDTDISSDDSSTTDNEENVPNQVNSIYTDASNYSIAY